MPENEGTNTLMDLMKYFSIPDRPVGPAEFKPFWESCTDAEKQEFKNADLSKR